MTGDTLDSSASLMTQLRTRQQERVIKNRSRLAEWKTIIQKSSDDVSITSINTNRLAPQKNASQYIKCDEVGIYGI